jgi:cytochrome c oxidase assembly protein Cox11
VIITMSSWGVVQRRIPGTSNQVNWPVSFESSVLFCFEERVLVGFESSVMFVAFLVDDILYV